MTDDGEALMGEAPEVTMPQVVNLIGRQGQALREIRSYHEPRSLTCVPPSAQRRVCETCRDVDGDRIDYPCPTIATLDRLGV